MVIKNDPRSLVLKSLSDKTYIFARNMFAIFPHQSLDRIWSKSRELSARAAGKIRSMWGTVKGLQHLESMKRIPEEKELKVI